MHILQPILSVFGMVWVVIPAALVLVMLWVAWLEISEVIKKFSGKKKEDE